jgi:hypothetical protein
MVKPEMTTFVPDQRKSQYLCPPARLTTYRLEARDDAIQSPALVGGGCFALSWALRLLRVVVTTNSYDDIHQGDLERGLQCCNEALALGPLPYDAAMAKALRGYGKIKEGRIDAGIADLSESVAWFESSSLRYTRARYALWLAEGHLRCSDHAAARSLIEDVLETSRTMGYLHYEGLHYEGLACWLTGECLAPEAPAVAEPSLLSAST